MSLLRATAAVAAKDLRVELRGRYGAGAVLPFAATLLVAFGLSIGPGRTLLQQTAPGLLWMAVLFASVLSFRESYRAESEDGAIEGLLLAPMDKAAVFLGKAAAGAAQLLVLEAIIVLLVAALFDVSVAGGAGTVAAAFALGTVGLAAIGSLFGALDAAPRTREAILPLLILPLATPVLLAGVRATALAIEGRPGAGSWLALLVAFDALFLATGTLVFGHLLED